MVLLSTYEVDERRLLAIFPSYDDLGTKEENQKNNFGKSSER